MSIYDNENTAVARLVKGKTPSCVDALEKGFWQARGEGLGVREAFYKSSLLHLIADHNGLNVQEEGFPLNTDEEVYAHALKGLEDSIKAGETDGEELMDIFDTWYKQARAWGGNVFLSYKVATLVVTEIYDEMHDLDEADAHEHIAAFPLTSDNKDVYDLLVKTYRDERAAGNTVRASLQEAMEASQELHERKQAEAYLDVLRGMQRKLAAYRANKDSYIN